MLITVLKEYGTGEGKVESGWQKQGKKARCITEIKWSITVSEASGMFRINEILNIETEFINFLSYCFSEFLVKYAHWFL